MKIIVDAELIPIPDDREGFEAFCETRGIKPYTEQLMAYDFELKSYIKGGQYLAVTHAGILLLDSGDFEKVLE